MSEEVLFIDNGNSPEYFASGLHSVEAMGPVVRFVLFVEKRMSTGEIVREPPFTCILPTEAIGAAIALTLRTLGARIVVPAIGAVARELALH